MLIDILSMYKRWLIKKISIAETKLRRRNVIMKFDNLDKDMLMKNLGLDYLDIKILREYDDDTINEIDVENVVHIFKYLNDNDVYYYKDLFLISLDLFLLPYNYFIDKFEKLKEKLGEEYVDLLGNDISLIEIMYE